MSTAINRYSQKTWLKNKKGSLSIYKFFKNFKKCKKFEEMKLKFVKFIFCNMMGVSFCFWPFTSKLLRI
jgi:hypothetical protein